MKTIYKSSTKIKYNTPVIKKIAIDNEISLILTSIPQPNRQYDGNSEEYSCNDPFKKI